MKLEPTRPRRPVDPRWSRPAPRPYTRELSDLGAAEHPAVCRTDRWGRPMHMRVYKPVILNENEGPLGYECAKCGGTHLVELQ